MAANSFPALAIKPPADVGEMIQKVQQIRGERQSQELGSIQLEEARAAQQSRMTLTSLFAKNGGDMNQTLADAKASGKVTPTDLINFQTHAVDMQTKATQLSEAQLALESKTNDVLVNHLESFKQLPQDARTPDTVKGLMSGLSSQGVDISKYVPAFQSLAQNPTDDNIKNIEIGLKGRQWVIGNEKAQREEASAPAPEEVRATRAAEYAKTVAQTNEAAAKASLDTKQATLAGTVTAKDAYERQTQLLKAVYERQTGFANTLQQSGLKQLDTMFADPQHGYIQFLAQAQNTKNTISQARNGSEVAASLEPLMTALGVTSFAGVHRINQTEVDAAGPGVGSLYRKLNSVLDKAGSGSVPEDTLKEVDALVDGMIDSKHSSVVNGAKMVTANAGLDPAKVTVMGRDGTLKTLDKAADETPKTAAPSARPAPAVGSIEGGYKFKGGDPSKPESWEKQP